MIYDVALKIADLLFGWILWLPGDLPLFALAGLTSLALIGARKIGSDQDLLRRFKSDRRRLKELLRQAKSAGDREAIQRHRGVLGEIALRMARAEFRPLLLALPALILIGVWGFERLSDHPASVGETIEVKLRAPLSASGQLVHLGPLEGVTTQDGWIRKFAPSDDGSAWAAAQWQVKADRAGVYPLAFHLKNETYVHPLAIGQGTYGTARVVQSKDGETVSEIALSPRRLLGFVRGVEWAGIADWMLGYLIIAIILFIIMKRIINV